MWRSALVVAAVLGFFTGFTLWSAASAAPSAGQGEQLFNKMCTGCHGLDSGKEGPQLRGVFGRAAGTVAGFPYSESIKKAGLVWDDATLDKWLTDPSALVADNDMAFRLDNAGQRADIIAYLKTLVRK